MSKRELRRQLQHQEERVVKLERALTRARMHSRDSDYRRQERIRLEHLTGSQGQARDERRLNRDRESERELEMLLKGAREERERLKRALRAES